MAIRPLRWLLNKGVGHEGNPAVSVDDWDAQCEKARQANSEVLDDFCRSLSSAGLSKSTVDRHVNNVDFFVNHYLLYDGITPPSEGIEMVRGFLGYWFIRKAMWASEAQIRANAASLKKFYAFMCEAGQVSRASLAELRATIKEEMPEWLETMRRWDDPSVESVWDF